MVHDQPQQPVEQRQIDLFVHPRQDRLHHDQALSLGRLPDIREVVDTLAPLVDKQRRGLGIRRLDPRGEQTPLVGLKVEELVEIRVRNLLDGLDIVTRDELVVRVEKLDAGLLECPLGEEEPLDPGETLVWVIVSLLDEGELFPLRLVETSVYRVGLLELFEGEHEKLGVVLVREGREGDGGEFPGLEPVNGRGVDGDGLLRADIGSVLEVPVLPLLLRLEVETGKTTEVLPDDRLVDGGTAPNTLSLTSQLIVPSLCYFQLTLK